MVATGIWQLNGKFLVQISIEPSDICIPSTLMPAKKHMNNSIKDVCKVKFRKQVTNVLQGFACNLVVFHMRTQLGKNLRR